MFSLFLFFIIGNFCAKTNEKKAKFNLKKTILAVAIIIILFYFFLIKTNFEEKTINSKKAKEEVVFENQTKEEVVENKTKEEEVEHKAKEEEIVENKTKEEIENLIENFKKINNLEKKQKFLTKHFWNMPFVQNIANLHKIHERDFVVSFGLSTSDEKLFFFFNLYNAKFCKENFYNKKLIAFSVNNLNEITYLEKTSANFYKHKTAFWATNNGTLFKFYSIS